MGCPIRKSTDQSLFAAPHGLSQRITSFIACACQGIHQMPLRHLIVLIANAHPDPAPKRRTERGRTFAHSSDTANMRLRATAPHVLQRYPANMNAPTKSIHAGKKTSFQRRNPMMAVRHINPGVSHTCLQISNRLRNTRVDPKGDEPSGTSFQTEPHPQGTTYMAPASHDPSGPVFSSPCHQNRQTAQRTACKPCLLPGCPKPRPTARHQSIANGGACRDRTDDPLLAKQMLSQLS